MLKLASEKNNSLINKFEITENRLKMLVSLKDLLDIKVTSLPLNY